MSLIHVYFPLFGLIFVNNSVHSYLKENFVSYYFSTLMAGKNTAIYYFELFITLVALD